MTSKEEIGRVTHYYDKAGVAVVELSSGLRKGDQISIEGATTNFMQRVESIQIEHQPIEEARTGDAIGLKVVERARKGDVLYRITL
jgi:translation elongation factor EF-1alpha